MTTTTTEIQYRTRDEQPAPGAVIDHENRVDRELATAPAKLTARFILKSGMSDTNPPDGWRHGPREPRQGYFEVTILDPRTRECSTVANIYTRIPDVAFGTAMWAHQVHKADTIEVTADELDAFNACADENLSNDGMQNSRAHWRARCLDGWVDDAGDRLMATTRPDRFETT